MNWLYHFHVQPWEMGRYLEHELDAIEKSLDAMAKDAKN